MRRVAVWRVMWYRKYVHGRAPGVAGAARRRGRGIFHRQTNLRIPPRYRCRAANFNGRTAAAVGLAFLESSYNRNEKCKA